MEHTVFLCEFTTQEIDTILFLFQIRDFPEKELRDVCVLQYSTFVSKYNTSLARVRNSELGSKDKLSDGEVHNQKHMTDMTNTQLFTPYAR